MIENRRGKPMGCGDGDEVLKNEMLESKKKSCPGLRALRHGALSVVVVAHLRRASCTHRSGLLLPEIGRAHV